MCADCEFIIYFHESNPHSLLNRVLDKKEEKKTMSKEKWIQDAIKPDKKGALRKALHVKESSKIPESKLKKAEHSKSPLLAKRANLADTLKGLRK